MPRHLHLDDDGLTVAFTGGLRLATLHRRLFVPWAGVRDVSDAPYDGPPLHGRFRRRGRWVFLSFDDPRRVVRVEVDPGAPGAPPYDELVFGADDPRALASRIAAWGGLGGHAHVQGGLQSQELAANSAHPPPVAIATRSPGPDVRSSARAA